GGASFVARGHFASRHARALQWSASAGHAVVLRRFRAARAGGDGLRHGSGGQQPFVTAGSRRRCWPASRAGKPRGDLRGAVSRRHRPPMARGNRTRGAGTRAGIYVGEDRPRGTISLPCRTRRLNMRILLLTPSLPYPPHQGGAIRNFGIIRGLREAGHEISLLSFHTNGIDNVASPLVDLCTRLEVVPPPSRSRKDRLRDMLLTRQPDIARRLLSAAFRQRLIAMLDA